MKMIRRLLGGFFVKNLIADNYRNTYHASR